MLLLNEIDPTQTNDTGVKQAMEQEQTDIIDIEIHSTLAGVLLERIRRSPDGLAYREFDSASESWVDTSWAGMGRETARWRAALLAEGMQAGERVAVQLRNCRAWACFDLAAQSLGLVTVPLYPNDRAENTAYIVQHSESRLLLIGDADAWRGLRGLLTGIDSLQRVLSLESIAGEDAPTRVTDWLPEQAGELSIVPLDPDALATIVYTSGTTGRSKGVMLSHRNILCNIRGGLHCIPIYPHDLFLSFLPLSHALERTVGFYLPIVAGAGVAFARSVPQLAEDLVSMRPTVLIAVPRIFERVYGKLQDKIANGPGFARKLFASATHIGWQRFEHAQGRGEFSAGFTLWPVLDKLVAHKVRDRLGGRLRFAVCGGAPLSEEVARLFVGLGIPIAQGYGLTETSPIISANSLEDNVPASVGPRLHGVEVRIGEQEELLTRGPCVMLGYWKDPDTTAACIDKDGWLHTGDKARIEDTGHIFITGRLKEIIVLANGEKVPPGDMEMAIALDPLFEQVLVVGEGRPYLTALIVPEAEALKTLLEDLGLPADTDPDHPGLMHDVLQRIAGRLSSFPGYARIVRAHLVPTPWDIENGLMTPTMKLRRGRILKQYSGEVSQLYQGHP